MEGAVGEFGMWQILPLSFEGPPPVCMVLFPCRLTAAGVGRGFFMCHSAKRTVRSGGRTARTISRAKRTGTRAGTGQQVGGLCGASVSSPLQGKALAASLLAAQWLEPRPLTALACLWGCQLEGGQATTYQLRCSDGLWAGGLLLPGERT